MKFILMLVFLISKMAFADSAPTKCLNSVVYGPEHHRLQKVLLKLDFESRGTESSLYYDECVIADYIKTEDERKFYKLHRSTNINVSDKELINAKLIKRYVCERSYGLSDFYIVEKEDKTLLGWYSQFILKCPVTQL